MAGLTGPVASAPFGLPPAEAWQLPKRPRLDDPHPLGLPFGSGAAGAGPALLGGGGLGLAGSSAGGALPASLGVGPQGALAQQVWAGRGP